MVIARSVPRTRSGNKGRAIQASNDTIRTITLRDFDGLMVTADNDLNLQTKFSKRLINIVRGDDGALAVRQGTRLDVDLSTSTAQSAIDEDVEIVYTQYDAVVKILSSSYRPIIGQRITISGATAGAYGVSASHINGSRVVIDYDDDGFYIVSGMAANASSSEVGVSETISWSVDNWYNTDANILWGGNIHGHEVYATNAGDIIARDANNNVYNLFSDDIAKNSVLSLEVSDKDVFVKDTVASGQFSIDTTAATRPAVGDIIYIAGLTTDINSITVDYFNGFHVVAEVEVLSGSGPAYPTVIRFNIPVTPNADDTSTETPTINRSLATGWEACEIVTATTFNDRLLLANGVNKPVVVQFITDTEPQAQYIADPATGSNANTPIGKYITSGQDHTIIAGIPGRPNVVSISQTNTYTTWYGDSNSNAVEIDITRVAGSTSSGVTGITFHRDLLVITTERTTTFYRLNNFVDDLHVPTKIDAVTGFGAIAGRSLASIGDSLLGCDFVGVINLKETLLKDRFASNRASEPIAPTLIKAINNLTTLQATNDVWAVHNKRDDAYMLFVPYGENETWVFHFIRKELRRIQGWSVLRGWNFTAGWLTTTDRVKFASGMKVYIYGTSGDDITADFVDGETGTGIQYVWEMPWYDFDRRMHTKDTAYIKMDTRGTGAFTAQMFVDNIYYDNLELESSDDLEDDLNLPLLPYLSMLMRGGDSPGYGNAEQTYGSGRRTSDERLYAWAARCSIAKLRFSGTTDIDDTRLRYVSISLGYQNGGIRR